MMSNTATPATNDLPEDADPMIDALLAEFVPSDPEDRITPPDLTARILEQLETRDRAVVPPPVEREPFVASRGLAWSAPWFVATAAAIMLMVWASTGGDRDESQDAGRVAASASDSEENATDIPAPELAADASASGTISPKPIQGIPLDSPNVARIPSQTPDVLPIDRTTRPAPAEAIELVAAQIDESAEQYWGSLGVTPTPQAPNQEVVTRLKGRLGFVLPSQELDDPKQLSKRLATRRVSRELARRWLAQLGHVNVAELNNPARQPLVGEVAQAIAGEKPLDATLVGLIDGSSAHSAQWYEVIGGGNAEVISKRIAGLSMNADLRCVRCHDSKIGGDLTQDGYWSFVALMKNSLTRENDRWKVDPKKPPKPVFYELADGRARMATPRAEFLSDLPVPTDFASWSKSISDSGELADGLVNSMWQLVHGRGLTASPVDVDSAPIDAALQSIHDRLSDDLRENDFDIARTLALILHSPMARRSVPDALKAENAITADQSERRQALDLVGAYAAGIQTSRVPRRNRIELAMRRIGTRIDGSNALLAQPIIRESDGKPRPSPAVKKPSLEQLMSIDFPGSQSSLPVSWLRSIEDFDQQVKHLAYLSGSEQVPTDVRQAAEQLKKGGSRESALSRVWWILKQ